MATTADSFDIVADGLSLKRRLAKAERRNKVRAFLLVVPLLVFISFTFLAPIAFMMVRSVYDPLIAQELPGTTDALQAWNPAVDELPAPEVFEIAGRELADAFKRRTLGRIATRLNYDKSGMRSLNMKTGRKLNRSLKKGDEPADWQAELITIDKPHMRIGYRLEFLTRPCRWMFTAPSSRSISTCGSMS